MLYLVSHKYRTKSFIRNSNETQAIETVIFTGRQLWIGTQQTEYRQARNHKLKTEGRNRKRSGKFKVGITLGQVNQRRNTFIPFLNATPTHFGSSEPVLVFNLFN